MKFARKSQKGMSSRFKDLTGKRFGRLTAQWPAGKRIGSIVWLCLCDCGKLKLVGLVKLTSGNTRSCGCLQRECRITHGHSGVAGQKRSPEYLAWANMIQRCTNPKYPQWKDYGGREITVCPQWRESFAAFLKDVGFRPNPNLTIDRENNDGNYEPGNVRWVTRKVQSNNQRRSHK